MKNLEIKVPKKNRIDFLNSALLKLEKNNEILLAGFESKEDMRYFEVALNEKMNDETYKIRDFTYEKNSYEKNLIYTIRRLK